MTDKTLDLYFDAKKDAEEFIIDLEKEIYRLENLLVLAAKERIFKVVADPNNEKVYGIPSISYSDIKGRVLREEPRFADRHINIGVGILIRDGKIEHEVMEHTVSKLGVYRLKEEEK